MPTTNNQAVDKVISEIEAEADRSIADILAAVKTSTGHELGRLERHWLELGRYETAFAAIRVLTAKGWLRFPADVTASIVLDEIHRRAAG